MTLGMTRGEILLTAFIFALVYLAGLLPRIAARIAGSESTARPERPKGE